MNYKYLIKGGEGRNLEGREIDCQGRMPLNCSLAGSERGRGRRLLVSMGLLMLLMVKGNKGWDAYAVNSRLKIHCSNCRHLKFQPMEWRSFSKSRVICLMMEKKVVILGQDAA